MLTTSSFTNLKYNALLKLTGLSNIYIHIIYAFVRHFSYIQV